jgi:NADH-quinone oxidoreductase subunit J
MAFIFYLSSIIALLAAAMAISRRSAFHALLYVVVSLLAVAVIFFSLGAPFVAALEIIVYAGAIIVLFIFVVMMLNLGPDPAGRANAFPSPAMWIGPALLALTLLVELAVIVVRGAGAGTAATAVGPHEVALSLFGPYAIGVELASFLLLAGLVGAARLGSGTRSTGGAR